MTRASSDRVEIWLVGVLLVVLGHGPQPPYRGSLLRGQVDLYAVLLGHAVPAGDGSGPFHDHVAPLDLVTGHADGDYRLPRTSVRSATQEAPRGS